MWTTRIGRWCDAGVRPAPFATSVEAPPPLREHQHQNQHPEVSYEPEYDDPYGPLDPLPQDGYGGYGQHAHEDYNQPPLQGHYEVGYADTYEGAPTPAYGAPPGLSHPGYAPLSPGCAHPVSAHCLDVRIVWRRARYLC